MKDRTPPPYLVKEDVFAIGRVRGKWLERSIFADAMLLAQLLPKGSADCRNMSELTSNYLILILLARQKYAVCQMYCLACRLSILALPHWPTCSEMISLGIFSLPLHAALLLSHIQYHAVYLGPIALALWRS
jgi:hypothetical protein